MQLKEKEDGFTLSRGGEALFVHSRQEPAVFTGRGNPDIQMFRGNFQIEDYVTERTALRDWEIREKGDGRTVVRFWEGDAYSLVMEAAEEEGRLVLRFRDVQGDPNRFWLRTAAREEEKVYGCGEQFSYLNLRGRHFPLWTSEQGVGRNKETYVTWQSDVYDKAGGDYWWTFFPQPTFFSSRKYFLHVDSSVYMDFDFRNRDFHELQVWEVPRAIYLEQGEDYLDLASRVSSFFGRQPELPDWVNDGVWLGIQGGTQNCLDKIDRAEKHGVPVGGIWVQDWQGKKVTTFGKRLKWNWEWNQEMYPGLDKEIPKLRERGIRFLGYINPYVLRDESLELEAREKDFLAKTEGGDVYYVDFGEFECGVVDFTIPEACTWYKEVIKKNLIDFGQDGWMADFGEYLPTDLVLRDGDPMEMHNQWPAIWARINREAVEEAGKLGEVVFFMRAGYTGSQKYCTMMWAGDQNVDWSVDDGPASVVPAALSLACCGMGLHHSDIGGYTTLFEMHRTKELFQRWAEFAAFTPVMRTHEGNRPDSNWQFDSDGETLDHLAEMTKAFVHLKPYRKELGRINAEEGIGVMRPLFWHYPEEERAHEEAYEYLLGPDLLAAPVFEEGQTEKTVYLPKDRWVHLWTGTEYGGGEHTLKAPLGQPPVFYRKDSAWAELFRGLKG